MKLKVLRDPVDDDKFHDECGVFGVFGHPEAANLTYLGIHALQHRGQESAGIAALDAGKIQVHKAMGLVADIFTAEVLARLPGDAAIGHTRYSTSGQSRIENAQPFVSSGAVGPLAVAHNGNLVNAEEIRAALEEQGAIFTGTSDTELMLHLIARE
ncbi:MAG TPA: class II glutamine amidotransferase, partial [Myxococcales bacterium]|nr:class II glutamine amidotransferase [Myxococcales bacterium]